MAWRRGLRCVVRAASVRVRRVCVVCAACVCACLSSEPVVCTRVCSTCSTMARCSTGSGSSNSSDDDTTNPRGDEDEEEGKEERQQGSDQRKSDIETIGGGEGQSEEEGTSIGGPRNQSPYASGHRACI